MNPLSILKWIPTIISTVGSIMPTVKTAQTVLDTKGKPTVAIQEKNFLKSKGIWGGLIVSAIAAVNLYFGWDISTDITSEFVNNIEAVVLGVAGILSIVGRIKAVKN